MLRYWDPHESLIFLTFAIPYFVQVFCGLASENSTYGLSLINRVGLFPRHNVNATNNTKDGTGLITYIKKSTRFVDVRPLDHMLEQT